VRQEACVATLNAAIAAAQQKLVELNEEKGDSADLCGGLLQEVSKLDKRKRGGKVEVVVKGKYGGCDWDDITRLRRADDNGEIKTNWLKVGHEHHDAETMSIFDLGVQTVLMLPKATRA